MDPEISRTIAFIHCAYTPDSATEDEKKEVNKNRFLNFFNGFTTNIRSQAINLAERNISKILADYHRDHWWQKLADNFNKFVLNKPRPQPTPEEKQILETKLQKLNEVLNEIIITDKDFKYKIDSKFKKIKDNIKLHLPNQETFLTATLFKKYIHPSPPTTLAPKPQPKPQLVSQRLLIGKPSAELKEQDDIDKQLDNLLSDHLKSIPEGTISDEQLQSLLGTPESIEESRTLEKAGQESFNPLQTRVTHQQALIDKEGKPKDENLSSKLQNIKNNVDESLTNYQSAINQASENQKKNLKEFPLYQIINGTNTAYQTVQDKLQSNSSDSQKFVNEFEQGSRIIQEALQNSLLEAGIPLPLQPSVTESIGFGTKLDSPSTPKPIEPRTINPPLKELHLPKIPEGQASSVEVFVEPKKILDAVGLGTKNLPLVTRNEGLGISAQKATEPFTINFSLEELLKLGTSIVKNLDSSGFSENDKYLYSMMLNDANDLLFPANKSEPSLIEVSSTLAISENLELKPKFTDFMDLLKHYMPLFENKKNVQTWTLDQIKKHHVIHEQLKPFLISYEKQLKIMPASPHVTHDQVKNEGWTVRSRRPQSSMSAFGPELPPNQVSMSRSTPSQLLRELALPEIFSGGQHSTQQEIFIDTSKILDTVGLGMEKSPSFTAEDKALDITSKGRTTPPFSVTLTLKELTELGETAVNNLTTSGLSMSDQQVSQMLIRDMHDLFPPNESTPSIELPSPYKLFEELELKPKFNNVAEILNFYISQFDDPKAVQEWFISQIRKHANISKQLEPLLIPYEERLSSLPTPPPVITPFKLQRSLTLNLLEQAKTEENPDLADASLQVIFKLVQGQIINRYKDLIEKKDQIEASIEETLKTSEKKKSFPSAVLPKLLDDESKLEIYNDLLELGLNTAPKKAKKEEVKDWLDNMIPQLFYPTVSQKIDLDIPQPAEEIYFDIPEPAEENLAKEERQGPLTSEENVLKGELESPLSIIDAKKLFEKELAEAEQFTNSLTEIMVSLPDEQKEYSKTIVSEAMEHLAKVYDKVDEEVKLLKRNLRYNKAQALEDAMLDSISTLGLGAQAQTLEKALQYQQLTQSIESKLQSLMLIPDDDLLEEAGKLPVGNPTREALIKKFIEETKNNYSSWEASATGPRNLKQTLIKAIEIKKQLIADEDRIRDTHEKDDKDIESLEQALTTLSNYDTVIQDRLTHFYSSDRQQKVDVNTLTNIKDLKEWKEEVNSFRKNQETALATLKGEINSIKEDMLNDLTKTDLMQIVVAEQRDRLRNLNTQSQDLLNKYPNFKKEFNRFEGLLNSFEYKLGNVGSESKETQASLVSKAREVIRQTDVFSEKITSFKTLYSRVETVRQSIHDFEAAIEQSTGEQKILLQSFAESCDFPFILKNNKQKIKEFYTNFTKGSEDATTDTINAFNKYLNDLQSYLEDGRKLKDESFQSIANTTTQLDKDFLNVLQKNLVTQKQETLDDIAWDVTVQLALWDKSHQVINSNKLREAYSSLLTKVNKPSSSVKEELQALQEARKWMENDLKELQAQPPITLPDQIRMLEQTPETKNEANLLRQTFIQETQKTALEWIQKHREIEEDVTNQIERKSLLRYILQEHINDDGLATWISESPTHSNQAQVARLDKELELLNNYKDKISSYEKILKPCLSEYTIDSFAGSTSKSAHDLSLKDLSLWNKELNTIFEEQGFEDQEFNQAMSCQSLVLMAALNKNGFADETEWLDKIDSLYSKSTDDEAGDFKKELDTLLRVANAYKITGLQSFKNINFKGKMGHEIQKTFNEAITILENEYKEKFKTQQVPLEIQAHIRHCQKIVYSKYEKQPENLAIQLAFNQFQAPLNDAFNQLKAKTKSALRKATAEGKDINICLSSLAEVMEKYQTLMDQDFNRSNKNFTPNELSEIWKSRIAQLSEGLNNINEFESKGLKSYALGSMNIQHEAIQNNLSKVLAHARNNLQKLKEEQLQWQVLGNDFLATPISILEGEIEQLEKDLEILSKGPLTQEDADNIAKDLSSYTEKFIRTVRTYFGSLPKSEVIEYEEISQTQLLNSLKTGITNLARDVRDTNIRVEFNNSLQNLSIRTGEEDTRNFLNYFNKAKEELKTNFQFSYIPKLNEKIQEYIAVNRLKEEATDPVKAAEYLAAVREEGASILKFIRNLQKQKLDLLEEADKPENSSKRVQLLQTYINQVKSEYSAILAYEYDEVNNANGEIGSELLSLYVSHERELSELYVNQIASKKGGIENLTTQEIKEWTTSVERLLKQQQNEFKNTLHRVVVDDSKDVATSASPPFIRESIEEGKEQINKWLAILNSETIKKYDREGELREEIEPLLEKYQPGGSWLKRLNPAAEFPSKRIEELSVTELEEWRRKISEVITFQRSDLPEREISIVEGRMEIEDWIKQLQMRPGTEELQTQMTNLLKPFVYTETSYGPQENIEIENSIEIDHLQGNDLKAWRQNIQDTINNQKAQLGL